MKNMSLTILVIGITVSCTTPSNKNTLMLQSHNFYKSLFYKPNKRKPADSSGNKILENYQNERYVETQLDGIWLLFNFECPQGSQVKEEDKAMLDYPELFMQFVFASDELIVRAKGPRSETEMNVICNYESRSKYTISEDIIVPIQSLGGSTKCDNGFERNNNPFDAGDNIRFQIRSLPEGVDELLLSPAENESMQGFCTGDKDGKIVFRKAPLG